MSAEYMAERVCDAIAELDGVEVHDDPMENVRSGGYWFEVKCKGRTYEVEITETRQG